MCRQNKLLMNRVYRSRTKASMRHTDSSGAHGRREIPSNLRLIAWNELEKCVESKLIGKGAFAKCFVAQLGSLKVCIKLLYAGMKYKSLLVKESSILLELCHFNLPWIHGFCNDSCHTAIVMSFHAFCGADVSLNIHDALHAHDKPSEAETEISNGDWKQVLLGCVLALEYLEMKKILHKVITYS